MGRMIRCIAILALLFLASCGKSAEPEVEPNTPPAPGETATPASPAGARTEPLFIIERSKNANVVHYDARLTPDGKLDPEQPVEAYWILHAEDGRREDLSWIQRKKAYGFTVEPKPSGDAYTMMLVPLPGREITVRKAGDDVRAEMVIDGERAVLERVYIESSSTLFGPKVHYVDIFGRDLDTGEERVERIEPE